MKIEHIKADAKYWIAAGIGAAAVITTVAVTVTAVIDLATLNN